MKVKCSLCIADGKNIEFSELEEILCHFEEVHLENKKK